MAYDKILPIRGRLDDRLRYVLNEEKTHLPAALGYIGDSVKTQGQLVTALNCGLDRPYQDMKETKRRWDKTGGVQGYHIIHSFAPGEVTAQAAHEAGVEFARRLLGDRFEAVVATHTDHEHLHCHVVFNSVSFLDGSRYRDDFKAYFHDIRGVSNAVSRERGLSVIEPEGRGRPYAEWAAEKQGRPTIRALVRADLDAALARAYTYKALLARLRELGYELREDRKHPAVRPPGGSRFIRLDSLGPGYTVEDLKARVAGSWEAPPPQAVPALPPVPAPRPVRRYKVTRGVLPRVWRRPRSFRALYLYYLYLLTGPRRARRPVPFQVRKEVLRLERYKAQFYFLRAYRVDTTAQLSMLTDAFQADVDALTERRKELYRRKREGYEVSGALEGINERLRQARRGQRLCAQVTQDQPDIRRQVQAYRQEAREDKTKIKERRADRWM